MSEVKPSYFNASLLRPFLFLLNRQNQITYAVFVLYVLNSLTRSTPQVLLKRFFWKDFPGVARWPPIQLEVSSRCGRLGKALNKQLLGY